MVKTQVMTIIIYFVWTALAITLVTLAVLSKTQPLPGNSNVVALSGKNVNTITSFTDTKQNNWNFRVSNSGTLEYVWTANNQTPRVVWDSLNGSCGPNLANNTLMNMNTSVSTRTEGITLGQTSMFIDNFGVQRTFRLQLYNADVRIESTNGDGKYWSIYGANNNLPVGWPSSISDPFNILWQSAGANLTVVSPFYNDGDLVVSQPNGSFQTFQASIWSNPVC
jgi:hypothetical protein